MDQRKPDTPKPWSQEPVSETLSPRRKSLEFRIDYAELKGLMLKATVLLPEFSCLERLVTAGNLSSCTQRDRQPSRLCTRRFG